MTGYRYAPPDPRDYVYEKAVPVTGCPPSYMTDISAVGVYFQGTVPDCVENAVTKVKQFHTYKTTGKVLDYSRRFLVYWTVLLDAFTLDKGTVLLNALKEAKKRGICEAQYFPDDHSLDIPTFSTTVPSGVAVANGSTNTISSYCFLSDLSADGLKHAIYQNGMVIVGLHLDKNWWTNTSGDNSWIAKDILPLRPPTDSATMSGHACILYGYDENYFYVLNSFGSTWGNGGTGFFGKEYLPFVYQGATIVDLTPEQLKAVQVVDTIDKVNAVASNTTDPAVKASLQGVVADLWKQFLAIFQ